MLGVLIAAPIAGILLAVQKIRLDVKHREAMNKALDQKAATQARMYAARNAISILLIVAEKYQPKTCSNKSYRLKAIGAGRAALGYNTNPKTKETK